MFRTESQRNASRENGAKSHGPVTPEGKERSSRNAARHGLFSDSVLLQPENRAAWNQLAEDLVARFNPADNVELAIIHDMAVTQWRKERAQNMEAAILDMEYQIIDMTESEAEVAGDEIRRIALAWSNAVGKHKALDDLNRQTIRLGNYWMRLHRKLKELQADRNAAEPARAAGDAPPPEPVKPESKNEPGVVEISSFQRPAAPPAPATPRTGTEPNGAATARESVVNPENKVGQPCTASNAPRTPRRRPATAMAARKVDSGSANIARATGRARHGHRKCRR